MQFDASPLSIGGLVALGLVVAAVLVFLGSVLQKRSLTRRLDRAHRTREGILAEAARDADACRREALAEASAEAARLRDEQKGEAERAWSSLRTAEQRLAETESSLATREARLEERLTEQQRLHDALREREETARRQEEELRKREDEVRLRLERIGGLSREEARLEVLETVRAEAVADAARLALEIKDEAVRNAEREARRLLTIAMERCAADHCSESTVAVVALPSEEMKGRIIGREGRNIRSFEAATGIDVIIDDTPEAVVLSGFDPVRREVARLALERLVTDGRIHPGRIEEIVTEAQTEVEEKTWEAGERAVLDLGLHDVDEQLIRHVGRLRYRTSFGQNCLSHSLEVAQMARTMAAEVGLDERVALRAGILHDVGKAVDMNREGTHSEIGAELAQAHGESDEVVNCIAAHHGDVEAATALAPLIQAADALSGARPGARRESFDTYIKRLTDLERIAHGFDGVDKAYAIQAGREIRVVVENDSLDDAGADHLATQVSKRIEGELQYPGQIKVVVIRESRFTRFAR